MSVSISVSRVEETLSGVEAGVVVVGMDEAQITAHSYQTINSVNKSNKGHAIMRYQHHLLWRDSLLIK